MSDFVNTVDELGVQPTLDALVADTLTEFRDNTITTIRSYGFYNKKKIQRVIMPKVNPNTNYIFANATALTEVDFSDTSTNKSIGEYAFQHCYFLKRIVIPSCTTLNKNAFENCYSLHEISMPNVKTIKADVFKASGVGKIIAPMATGLAAYMIENVTTSTVDLTSVTNIAAETFKNAAALVELILRNSSMVSLANINAFTGTPIGSGVGYIYVPSNLVDTYKAASNWSTLSSCIRSIDEYPIQSFSNETITDTWGQILEAEENGTYSTKYSIGDIKYVDIYGTKVPMEIAAFDTDDTDNNGGKAKITWISKTIIGYNRVHKSNIVTNYWASSDLRTFLREDIYLGIDTVVKNAIVPVIKSYISNNGGTSVIEDTVWAPSMHEITGNSSDYENSGADYSATSFSDTDKKKRQAGLYGTNIEWWTRSATKPNYGALWNSISTSGSSNRKSADTILGIVIGFCT